MPFPVAKCTYRRNLLHFKLVSSIRFVKVHVAGRSLVLTKTLTKVLNTYDYSDYSNIVAILGMESIRCQFKDIFKNLDLLKGKNHVDLTDEEYEFFLKYRNANSSKKEKLKRIVNQD